MAEEQEPQVQITTPAEPEKLEVPLEREQEDDPADPAGPSRDERRRERGKTYGAQAREAIERAERLERQLQEERDARNQLAGQFQEMQRAISTAGQQPEVPRELSEIDREIDFRKNRMETLNAKWLAAKDAAARAEIERQHGEEYKTLEREAIRLEGKRGAVEERLSAPQQQQPQRNLGVEMLQVHFPDVVKTREGVQKVAEQVAVWRARNPGREPGPQDVLAFGQAARVALAGPGRREAPTKQDRERFAAPGRSAGGSSGKTASIDRTEANYKQAQAMFPGMEKEQALAELARVRARGRQHLGT